MVFIKNIVYSFCAYIADGQFREFVCLFFLFSRKRVKYTVSSVGGSLALRLNSSLILARFWNDIKRNAPKRVAVRFRELNSERSVWECISTMSYISWIHAMLSYEPLSITRAILFDENWFIQWKNYGKRSFSTFQVNHRCGCWWYCLFQRINT